VSHDNSDVLGAKGFVAVLAIVGTVPVVLLMAADFFSAPGYENFRRVKSGLSRRPPIRRANENDSHHRVLR